MLVPAAVAGTAVINFKIFTMEMISPISVMPARHSRLSEVDFTQLGFGQHLSDHMLVCDYNDGGWSSPQIIPLSDLTMHPATLALHYGQTVFEGMKAFRLQDGREGKGQGLNIFRMRKHYERFARSLHRMCMPVPPVWIFMEGLKELVNLDRDWIPSAPGTALYIRPFVYASEAKLGIKIAEQYRFVVITGPVPELYPTPLRVKVETDYIRAARGGTGYAKCGGNYGAAFYPTLQAREQGYDQVIWTDARENKYIEESGTMNIMFVINGTLVTAPLSDSILDGVTRDSLLQLAKDMGYAVEERQVSVEELERAFLNKTVTEIFGAGTAAVVAPIRVVGINGIDYELPIYDHNSLQNRLKSRLEQIRTGLLPDGFGWNHQIPE